MIILPAIDLYEGKVVRLTGGDYNKMTVYSDDPLAVARSFLDAGAEQAHVVDLEGARDGTTASIRLIRSITEESGLKIEVGGGVRSEVVVERYLEFGVERVILGTAAVTQPGFVGEMVRKYGERIAVGVDIRDGRIAIKGWTELSDKNALDFCRELEDIGVKTIVCTDISRDGVLDGTNLGLYLMLTERKNLNVIASGGITTMQDIDALRVMNLYGAVVGKAIYTKNIDLAEAVKLTRGTEAAG